MRDFDSTYPGEQGSRGPRGRGQNRDHRGHGPQAGGREGGREGGRGRRGRPGAPDDGFGPGSGSGRSGRSRARRGDVRGAILSLLADNPQNGYGLIKAISERSEGVWRPSPGSVYPTLQQLVDEGLIAQAGSEGTRNDYALTDSGQAYVEENKDALDRAWTPMAQAISDRGALVAASRKLSGVIRQIGVDGTPAQRELASGKIDALRKELYRILAED